MNTGKELTIWKTEQQRVTLTIEEKRLMEKYRADAALCRPYIFYTPSFSVHQDKHLLE